MKRNTQTLIEVLQDRQRALSLNDGEFAAQLEISRPLWVQVRSRSKPVGLQLLRGVARVFPDLDGLVLAFLRGETPEDEA